MNKQKQAASISDIFLPLTLVAVVGMMIFPLPIILLDFILMANITFALLLIISVVYVLEPEKFTSLPTMLLLATLVRLALNISTTRFILSTGSAPDIITAFSQFVVQGNLVVGLVIFLIITLVQFLVIAKGAERVAEVSARFSLDAMPGKQMAIDADIRTGILSLAEGRAKRNDLQTESRLYGSLDGAMRFVKGDAIAGLVITGLNIFAGIAIGMAQHSLSFSQAAEKFTFYTIGDGLVSQIPALLVAVAAGIAVTRVAGTGESLVGKEILNQLGNEPQALAITSLVLFAAVFIPGMPSLLFFLGSLAFAALACKISASQKRSAGANTEFCYNPKVLSGLQFKVSSLGAAILQQEKKLTELVQQTRQKVFDSMGILVPDIQYEFDPSSELASVKISLPSRRDIAVVAEESKESKLPSKSNCCFSKKICQRFECEILNNLPCLVDDKVSRVLLEIHSPVCEGLINSIVPEKLSMTALTRLLRDLVAERVSVRNLHLVLQAVSEYIYLVKNSSGQTEKSYLENAPELLAWVRISLKAEIADLLGDKVLAVCVPEEVDQAVVSSCYFQDKDSSSLKPNIVKALEKLEDQPENVVLSTAASRPMLASSFGDQFKDLKFIAFEELYCEEQISSLRPLDLSLPALSGELLKTDFSNPRL